MRWCLLASCLVACGGEQDTDRGGPSGPAPLAPLSGLEDALSGVEATDVFPSLVDAGLACAGSDWSVSADVGLGRATRIVAVRWDLDTGAFSGAWDLGGGGVHWEARIAAAELGADCDDPGATNLVVIPINGTIGGEAAGVGTAGSEAVCGYTALPAPNLYYQPIYEAADAASWRTAEIYRGAVAEGEMVPDGDGWSAEIPDPGWNSSDDMAPVMAVWGEVGGVPLGSCAL